MYAYPAEPSLVIVVHHAACLHDMDQCAYCLNMSLLSRGGGESHSVMSFSYPFVVHPTPRSRVMLRVRADHGKTT